MKLKVLMMSVLTCVLLGTSVSAVEKDLDFLVYSPGNGATVGAVRYDFGKGVQVEGRLGSIATSTGGSDFQYGFVAWYEYFGLGIKNAVSGANDQDAIGYELLLRLEHPLNELIAVGIATNVASFYPKPLDNVQFFNDWRVYMALNFLSL